MKRICIAVNGTITITWFQFNDTCDRFIKTEIYGRPDQFSNYKLLDSVKSGYINSYVLANGANYLGGSFFIKCYVFCGGTQILVSDVLAVDVNPPPKTDPDSVSVMPDGSVVVGWSAVPVSDYNDTKSFIIYSVSSGNFPVDTILRKDGSLGFDKKSGANKGPVRYLVAPVDSCDNVAPLGNYHTTVFLGAKQDSCKYEVSLTWSDYMGWVNGVSYYEIYYSLDSTRGYTFSGTSAGNNYTFKGLKNNTKYYFFVRAVKTDSRRITSSSNRISLITQFSGIFKYVYIKAVSVEGNTISVRWTTNNNLAVGFCELYKGKNPGSMRLLAKIPGSVVTGNEFRFTDTDVDPGSEVWMYKVLAYNTCGHYGGVSNISHNILLSILKSGTGKQLSWNAYNSWSGKVMLYEILRMVSDSKNVVESIGQESGYGFNFLDADSFSDYLQPGVCYQVKALEGDSDKYGFTEESLSNKVCYIDPPVVYIPNAFVPDEGVNDKFKPTLSYVDTVASVLTIYNRWGEVVYITNHVTAGWNGKMKEGKLAPGGVYLYNLKVVGLDKTIHMYKGAFTLL